MSGRGLPTADRGRKSCQKTLLTRPDVTTEEAGTRAALAPGSPALVDHSKNVYLPERTVLGRLNAWMGERFDRGNIDDTVAELIASQNSCGAAGTAGSAGREAMKQRLHDAEK